MMKYVRYALASVCFAASVACLALWGWTVTHRSKRLVAFYPSNSCTVNYFANVGVMFVGLGHPLTPRQTAQGSQFVAITMSEMELMGLNTWRREHGLFGYGNRSISCPLWYPALIFALAGVASLRLGSRFTLRSAIIATTVVAVLLGMAVIL